MGKDTRVHTVRARKPDGISTGTLCEELGWAMSKLLAHVERGELPTPDVFNGELVWSYGYLLNLRAHGLRLPGTFPGLPPGITALAECRKWLRVPGKGSEVRYRYVGQKSKRPGRGGRKYR